MLRCAVLAAGLGAAAWAPRPSKRLGAARATLEDLSDMVEAMAPSATIEVHGLTMQMRAAGEDVISLSVGEPDFAPPRPILEAIAAAALNGQTRYTEVGGTLELRTAVARDLRDRRLTDYKPEQVVVTNGAKQAVVQAVMALCGAGDEVVVPTPCWVSYPEIVKIAGAKPVFAESTIADGYKLTPDALRAALTPETKALILCNPSNPTGATLDATEQKALFDVISAFEARESSMPNKKIWVIADEIYERLCYTPEGSVPSFAALSDDALGRTVVVNGFSKAFAMTGFRLGYLAAPPHVAKAALKLQGQLTSCASSLSQAAGVAALKLPADALDDAVAEMARRRDYVMARLAKLAPRVECPPPPMGAFYVLPDVSKCFGLMSPQGPFLLLHLSCHSCLSFA